MSVVTEDRKPETREEFYARKRGGNLAIFACIMAFFLLFFVITILRMG